MPEYTKIISTFLGGKKNSLKKVILKIYNISTNNIIIVKAAKVLVNIYPIENRFA